MECKRAKGPLSITASHELIYQQLHGELQSALQKYKEAELEVLREEAINRDISTDDGIGKISYFAQPILRRGCIK